MNTWNIISIQLYILETGPLMTLDLLSNEPQNVAVDNVTYSELFTHAL